MRILIVDDDVIALELLRDSLVDGGHEVVSAENGRAALEMIQRDAPQVIISDWEMPELDGLGLAQQVRRSGLESYVYFILLTSHNSVTERVQGLSAGADDFMAKPFEPAELLARISSAERIVSLETRDVAIFALAKLAESRDPETGAHLERVMNYSRALATKLLALGHFTDQIDGEYVRLLYSTSPLHDIGKVGIPDAVLLKPGRLSDREFEIMKSHTTIGAETLAASLKRFPKTKFLSMARDVAAAHHERFDGTGYPERLVGEQIPLCARIVALADVYDALTSKRVYKDAFAHEVAKGIILKDSGSHFDPRVVDAFTAAENEFVAIRDQFRELLSVAA
ncbi:MAG TPA: HD domain-containing phosphohydrolase [Tepidisphaeraceae bacterium]|jgi:putative two-component system response regulator|nr:HD domain-containing phosphohydrolase [Tepidisphaeraceae bacterium]